jgi:hypothetical protein
MLALTGPRVHAANQFIYRYSGLDSAAQSKGRKAIIKALQGGKHLTREEIAAALPAGLSEPTGSRFLHILMHAELEGIICSGQRRGKEHTYALLDERAPNARSLPRDEGLAALVTRYFTSHGPATMQDFAWWSGLTLTDTRAGLEIAKQELLHEEIGGQTYWFAEQPRGAKPSSRAAYLLPNYDEYIVAYRDRSAIFDGPHEPLMDARGNILFQHTIMLDGLIIGTWKRTLTKKGVTIMTQYARPPTAAQTRVVAAAAKRYGEFLGLPVSVA